MCSGKVLSVVAAPVTGAALVASKAVKGTASVIGSLVGGNQQQQTQAAAAPVEETKSIDTTKDIYKQDVTAKAVAAAQTTEAKRIKSRKGTGATIMTNPLGIQKAATVLKPTLGTSQSDEQKSNLLGL